MANAKSRFGLTALPQMGAEYDGGKMRALIDTLEQRFRNLGTTVRSIFAEESSTLAIESRTSRHHVANLIEGQTRQVSGDLALVSARAGSLGASLRLSNDDPAIDLGSGEIITLPIRGKKTNPLITCVTGSVRLVTEEL